MFSSSVKSRRADREPLLKTVWIPFATAIIVCAVVIYFVVKARFADQISTLNERIKLRDDQLGELQNRLKANSPNDALIKVEELQAKVEALSLGKWDLLTDQQKSKLRERLSALAPAKINVNMTNDARLLAFTLANIFEELGWKVERNFLFGHVSGLVVQPQTETATPVAEALRIEALLPTDVEDHALDPSMHSLMLTVGDRPFAAIAPERKSKGTPPKELAAQRVLDDLFAEGVKHRNSLMPTLQNYDDAAERAKVGDWSERVLQQLDDAGVSVPVRSRFRTLNTFIPTYHSDLGKSDNQSNVEGIWNEKLRRLRKIIDSFDRKP